MCAPHQGTMMPDCTPDEAAALLGVAGFDANPEFLDQYLREVPSNSVCATLRRVAEDRVALRDTLLAFPDNPEGGRQALDELRAFLAKDKPLTPVGLNVVAGPSPSGGSCCHRS